MRAIVLWPGAIIVEAPGVDPGPVHHLQSVSAATVSKKPLLINPRPALTRYTRAQNRTAVAIFPSLKREEASNALKAPLLEADYSPTYAEGSAKPRSLLRLPPALALPVKTLQLHGFSGSAWVLLRGDGNASLATGGQLGGSQLGARLFYAPGPRALAITARISAPLSQPTGREVAIGVALRGANFGLIAEQRVALDNGGKGSPAVFAYGGVSDVVLPANFKLEGYAQAGVVGAKSPATFVDGAVRVERTVLTARLASLSLGGGIWGGAQPGVRRVDIGPQVVARFAVADTNLRVSAEWRQRVAGNAIPASGPSVTVGFDF